MRSVRSKVKEKEETASRTSTASSSGGVDDDDSVDEGVVCIDENGLRRLSIWHAVGRLLQLDHLLVVEGAAVVHEPKRFGCLAVVAHGRF